MRKIYSLLLTAAALLVGINAWGQNTVNLVNATDASKSGDYATLQAAIDAIAPGQTGTITLNGPQNLDAGVLIPHLSAADTVGGKRIANLERQHITINLNGWDIMTKAGVKDACIALIKGELNIIGEGTIERAAEGYDGENWKRGAILVSGTDGMKDGYTGTWPVYNGEGISVLPADKVDRSKQEWSSLYIGKDVYVESTKAGTYGIGVQEIGSSYPKYGGFSKKFLGYSCVYTGKLNNTDNAMPMWNTTQDHKAAPNQDQLKETQYQWSCFGVKVVIDGKVHGERRGVNVLGSINQTPGVVEGATARKYAAYPYYDHYFPYVKIGKNAEVYCEPSGISDDGNGGIYLGGWAVIDIEGAVHGQTGIMVKAGDVLVQNGSVYSDCTTAANSGNYHATVAGSGIFITSSASYAGESSVTVSGDSYIAGNGGNAIIDVCATSTSEQTNTAVTHIDITGGTIVAGDQGAISLGTATSNVTDIKGGIVNGVVDIGDPSDEAERFHTDVTNLLPNTTEYHTTVIEDEDGKQTIVISQGTAPVAGNWVSKIDDTHPQIEGASVKWQVNSSDEIASDLRLTELEINDTLANGDPRDQVLTIKSGATLEVGRVIMGSKAKIIVQAGGTFIVSGNQGIVAPVVENIVLQHNSTTGKYATFLFNPAVSSNRHPNATVEFTTNSWWVSNEGENYQWEWFGIPTYNQAKAISSKAGNDAVYASVEVFENDTWTDLGYIGGAYDNNPAVLAKLDKPFNAYNLMAYRGPSAAAPTITISGELVGNVNASLNANMKWNTFANSYTAEIDAPALINYLAQHSQNIQPAVYVAENSGNSSITWDAKEADDIESLKPMQAFLLHNPRYVEETAINYADMVYGFSGNNAPRRARIASDNTAKICVNVANENGTWDDVVLRENVNTLTIEKYLNSDVNIYVVDGEKNDIVAYEDLENTYVGFSTVKGGNFTISFTKAEGREFDLIDLETGARIAASKGETYSFSAAANTTNDYRFKLVAPAKMPTAIENTEVKANAKGIFTITGQYVGEKNMWNSLPAGVYVIDGAKCVK